jgi:iron only hydrogenase large subunit-like protein
VTGAKITNKIRKIKGKLTKEKLKKIFKDEGIDIADDLTTLVDEKIGVDDALAILDLVVGVIVGFIVINQFVVWFLRVD